MAAVLMHKNIFDPGRQSQKHNNCLIRRRKNKQNNILICWPQTVKNTVKPVKMISVLKKFHINRNFFMVQAKSIQYIYNKNCVPPEILFERKLFQSIKLFSFIFLASFTVFSYFKNKL